MLAPHGFLYEVTSSTLKELAIFLFSPVDPAPIKAGIWDHLEEEHQSQVNYLLLEFRTALLQAVQPLSLVHHAVEARGGPVVVGLGALLVSDCSLMF